LPRRLRFACTDSRIACDGVVTSHRCACRDAQAVVILASFGAVGRAGETGPPPLPIFVQSIQSRCFRSVLLMQSIPTKRLNRKVFTAKEIEGDAKRRTRRAFSTSNFYFNEPKVISRRFPDRYFFGIRHCRSDSCGGGGNFEGLDRDVVRAPESPHVHVRTVESIGGQGSILLWR
jgi:hypothetical protein